jgi:hypothetical protein
MTDMPPIGRTVGLTNTGFYMQLGTVVGHAPFSIAVCWQSLDAAEPSVQWFNWCPGLKRHGVRHGDAADAPVEIAI